MTLARFVRPLTARPEIGLALAAFVGVALGAGLVPDPLEVIRSRLAPPPPPPPPASARAGDVTSASSPPLTPASSPTLSGSPIGWGGF